MIISGKGSNYKARFLREKICRNFDMTSFIQIFLEILKTQLDSLGKVRRANRYL